VPAATLLSRPSSSLRLCAPPSPPLSTITCLPPPLGLGKAWRPTYQIGALPISLHSSLSGRRVGSSHETLFDGPPHFRAASIGSSAPPSLPRNPSPPAAVEGGEGAGESSAAAPGRMSTVMCGKRAASFFEDQQLLPHAASLQPPSKRARFCGDSPPRPLGGRAADPGLVDAIRARFPVASLEVTTVCLDLHSACSLSSPRYASLLEADAFPSGDFFVLCFLRTLQ
jgi:hypothetical protein